MHNIDQGILKIKTDGNNDVFFVCVETLYILHLLILGVVWFLVLTGLNILKKRTEGQHIQVIVYWHNCSTL